MGADVASAILPRPVQRRTRHRTHGAPGRFDAVAEFIAQRYGRDVRYVADVAGGQGVLSRVLRKRFNYEAEVIDPRGNTLKGVPGRAREFSAESADFYDLVVGLHPDQATRAVAEAALVRPTILIPCCNFWVPEKLGQEELLRAIEAMYRERGVTATRVRFPFRGPKNVGLVSAPPA